MTRNKDHREGFEKIERSKQCLYGPRKLLLCGFSASAQNKFKSLLGILGLEGVPLVWVTRDEAEKLMKELFSQVHGSGAGKDSGLPRAIIAGGITQQELHRLMSGCRQGGMQQSLWAALTPTSEDWTLSQLLAALVAEAKAMAGKKRKK